MDELEAQAFWAREYVRARNLGPPFKRQFYRWYRKYDDQMNELYNSLKYRFENWLISDVRDRVEEDFKNIEDCVNEMIGWARTDVLEASRV